MTDEQRKKALYRLGAVDVDMDALLEYTKNVFPCIPDVQSDELSPSWPALWKRALEICNNPPHLEMFESVAGTVPIIYPASVADYKNLLREIVYKCKDVPHIEKMGASFVHGKTLRFIILSNKPYSGVAAEDMGLGEKEWLEKSVTIRKYHECAHYYTKRFFGLTRNHLHDELIADFCGLYAAFGEYRAEWFLKFYALRSGIYTKGLSLTAAAVVDRLAGVAANGVEAWTKTASFTRLDEAGRIGFLTAKELLEYTQ